MNNQEAVANSSQKQTHFPTKYNRKKQLVLGDERNALIDDKFLDNDKEISILVRLRGEMANLLSQLVFGKGVQLWIEQHWEKNISHVELVGERQAGNKWKSAVRDLYQCFPNLRNLTVQGGKWDPTFAKRKQQQKAWVGEDNHRSQLVIDKADSDCGGHEEWFCLYQQLAFFQKLRQQEIPSYVVVNMTRDEHDNHRYSLPFLTTNQLASFDVLVDQYYDQIKNWLQFDYGACCGPTTPYSDEVVFHLRNFRAEMGDRNYFVKGYQELSPTQLANELLGHLEPGARIAIVSRGDLHVSEYIQALQARGFVVRTTPPDYTGVQDFCFLLQTQRELVGTMRSTYTRWAALLGKAHRVQLYSIDSPFTRQAHGGNDNFTVGLHYQWRRPALQHKIHYRVFTSNETFAN